LKLIGIQIAVFAGSLLSSYKWFFT